MRHAYCVPRRAQGPRDGTLVRWVGEREEQADSHGIRAAARNPANHVGDSAARRTQQGAACVIHALAQTEAAFARGERLLPLDKEIVEARPGLAADGDHVLKSLCGDQGHPPATALQERVGAHGRPTGQVEFSEAAGALSKNPRECISNCLRGVAWGRRHFQNFEPPVAEKDAVGESSARINGNAHAPRILPQLDVEFCSPLSGIAAAAPKGLA